MTNNKATRCLNPEQAKRIRKQQSEFSFYKSLMQPECNSKQSTKHRTDEYIGFLNYHSKYFGRL